MKYEKNSKPPKCPIFSLILNFKIRPMGLKKKHESSRQNTSKMQVQISKREPTWTNVKREPTWNMKVHAKSWLRFTSGSRFTSVHVSRGNQTWHVGWGMRVYVYLLPPKKRKLTIPVNLGLTTKSPFSWGIQVTGPQNVQFFHDNPQILAVSRYTYGPASCHISSSENNKIIFVHP